MSKIIIFGNSGAGKSTLAKKLSDEQQLAHLDLDTLAWLPTTPPQRKPINESAVEIRQFIANNNSWVIEGCYADLLDIAATSATEIIFLNLPTETCIENANKRPWEPHKYPSKEVQNANLSMLIEWLAQYDVRTDTFSRQAHQVFYDGFSGKKTMHTENQ